MVDLGGLEVWVTVVLLWSCRGSGCCHGLWRRDLAIVPRCCPVAVPVVVVIPSSVIFFGELRLAGHWRWTINIVHTYIVHRFIIVAYEHCTLCVYDSLELSHMVT